MEFCIANISYWESVGFDTMEWRKSMDGIKAIVHHEYAKVLCNCTNNPDVTIYQYPSQELDNILNSPEWNSRVVR